MYQLVLVLRVVLERELQPHTLLAPHQLTATHAQLLIPPSAPFCTCSTCPSGILSRGKLVEAIHDARNSESAAHDYYGLLPERNIDGVFKPVCVIDGVFRRADLGTTGDENHDDTTITMVEFSRALKLLQASAANMGRGVPAWANHGTSTDVLHLFDESLPDTVVDKATFTQKDMGEADADRVFTLAGVRGGGGIRKDQFVDAMKVWKREQLVAAALFAEDPAPVREVQAELDEWEALGV